MTDNIEEQVRVFRALEQALQNVDHELREKVGSCLREIIRLKERIRKGQNVSEEDLKKIKELEDQLYQLLHKGVERDAHILLDLIRQLERLEHEDGKHVAHAFRIQIDETKKRRQVAEITGSEFFQGLQQKAQELRARNQ